MNFKSPPPKKKKSNRIELCAFPLKVCLPCSDSGLIKNDKQDAFSFRLRGNNIHTVLDPWFLENQEPDIKRRFSSSVLGSKFTGLVVSSS